MSKNLVNLNVNPCKMCMPMGTANAFYGIKKCMNILHGSQGCSTYIRRHMATHYNEPVDIASSSLTEEGTVYGGEKNLIIGLENLIKLYDPEVIGVSTTCLAETIGEDIEHIIKKFHASHPDEKVTIIPVKSAGYGGTQFEGFTKALRAIVTHVEMDATKHDKINVITTMISPADTRYLKDVLDQFGLEYILLPDLSENLDGVHQSSYHRLPMHGTPISDIKKMAGSRATIEISNTIKPDESAGVYLNETFGVPYKQLNLPMGLKNTDALMEFVSELTGKPIPSKITKERGRYLDGMVDSHKYNALGRIAIFGEPDFVISAVELCCENGIMPVIAATGSNCPQLKGKIESKLSKLADVLFVENYVILNDVDFETIEEEALKMGANLMLGNSDGRRIEEKHGIPLVRCAFPIHDRIGGQRIRTLGYEGSQLLLDQITNTILKKVEGSFRETLYNTYYNEGPKSKYGLEPETETPMKVLETKKPTVAPTSKALTIEEKTANHPCYSCDASHKNARMHLPVAPKCNIQCNYCVRKFDCPNESRPGVTTDILSPEAAFEKYKRVKEQVPNLTVVGIAGPGDALANFAETKKALTLIKAFDPDVTFCVSTNGLMLPYHAKELAALDVSHVTVTVNAVDPAIGAKIYKHVDFMGQRYHGEAAASILLANQLAGIKLLIDEGVIVKINTVTLKGINDDHIEEVVKTVKDLGCFISNVMQLIPVKGSAFEDLPIASNQEINTIRDKCGVHLKQMYHCKQCRADAIGKLDSDLSLEFREKEEKRKETAALSAQQRLRFAIVSKGGMLVDQHFGQASDLYIYDYLDNEVQFKEKRVIGKYCTGEEDCDEKEDKIGMILQTLTDCDGVISMRIGDLPAKRLETKGIKVFSTYDRIEDAVKTAAQEILTTKLPKSQELLNVSGGV